ncbi:MAG: folylpolyglutamate synthase/dihydrofolate synthase family protein [Marinoscillum sp.]
MNYQQVLNYLYERLPMFQRMGAPAIKKDLTNTILLLEGLGNPHHQFKSIHIAGTNGKGSSAHALSAVLQTAGYNTGLYTSPHLKSFTERIRINGVEVEEEFITRFVNSYQGLIEAINPSFFEVTVAMSFLYFAERKVDIAVVETGLGGRLDSTNVIKPEVSLITMIGYDHADLLGNTLEEIAAEKAGIMKEGIPVVIGANQPELRALFLSKAKHYGSPITFASYDVISQSDSLIDQGFEVSLGESTLRAKTDITASYFLKNIPGIYATIIELRKRGFEISDDNFVLGVSRVKSLTGLKGRWQVLHENPLVIADVSHNEPGLLELFKQVERHLKGQLHLIIGVVKDKDIPKMLKLLPSQAKLYFTQSSVPRSLDAQELFSKAKGYGSDGEVFTDVNAAILAAKKNAANEDLILVCGSTFVVAEIENL